MSEQEMWLNGIQPKSDFEEVLEIITNLSLPELRMVGGAIITLIKVREHEENERS